MDRIVIIILTSDEEHVATRVIETENFPTMLEAAYWLDIVEQFSMMDTVKWQKMGNEIFLRERQSRALSDEHIQEMRKFMMQALGYEHP